MLDKKFLDTKYPINDSPGDKLENLFKEFEYALFGLFPPEESESENLDIAQGAKDIEDMPPLETEKKAGK